jgi:site-specific recombinase XerD
LRKHEPRLTEFVGFLKAQGTDRITTKLALAWATAPTFFINERGGPISSPHKSFRDIRCAAGLEQIGNGIHPRMHDLRHTFAVQTLLAWYRSGADVERNLPILSTFLGHSHIEHTYWYLTSPPELLGAACERLEMRWESSMMSSENLAALLQTFFTDRLIAQRRVSPHTVASYRDTFRLLLQFTQKQLGRSPSHLGIVDLSSALIGAFLDDREKNRANATRSRNVRLTAIRSFFRYAALECPEHSAGIQRLLAIPPKRQSSRLVDFLTRPEIDALLEVPDQKTWLGRRDRVLLLFTIQTGLRLSELIGLRQDNIYLERGAHVRCEGKGRKQRQKDFTHRFGALRHAVAR